MMKMKLVSLVLGAALMVSSCGSNTKNGALIGAGGGALLGGIIGKVAGNTAAGAVIGTAVGAGAGALIGKRMDKVKAATEDIQNAQVESVTDANGLQAVKVTFDSGILFATGKSALSAAAQNSLKDFAEVLKENSDLEVAVYGHTDNTGSAAINEKLSLERAQSVKNYLVGTCGAANKQFAVVEGKSYNEPMASNDTEAGRAQNRRVEVYLYASKEMIDKANAGTLN